MLQRITALINNVVATVDAAARLTTDDVLGLIGGSRRCALP